MAGDPMARMKTILLGKIIKISGFEGAVTVRTERSFAGEIPEMESVFLEIEGRPVPFLLEYSESFGDGTARLKFEDYDTYEKVKEFAGCSVLIDASAVEPDTGAERDDLTGYELHDENGRHLGTITGVTENPGQLLLNVRTEKGGELLIPLHEDLIISADTEKKIITMTIPDGLTDLNN
jgi:16S rRNA processing protein RimM